MNQDQAALFELPASVKATIWHADKYWLNYTCARCGKGFTEASWAARHDDPYGEPLHERCCRRSGCRMARIAAQRAKKARQEHDG